MKLQCTFVQIRVDRGGGGEEAEQADEEFSTLLYVAKRNCIPARVLIELDVKWMPGEGDGGRH